MYWRCKRLNSEYWTYTINISTKGSKYLSNAMLVYAGTAGQFNESMNFSAIIRADSRFLFSLSFLLTDKLCHDNYFFIPHIHIAKSSTIIIARSSPFSTTVWKNQQKLWKKGENPTSIEEECCSNNLLLLHSLVMLEGREPNEHWGRVL